MSYLRQPHGCIHLQELSVRNNERYIQGILQKWAFKHPSGKDFVNVVNEVEKEHGMISVLI
jgi:hypothetical protein